MELTTEILTKLGAPFSADELEFLPRATSGGKAMALPYIDARNVMRRLDEVVGPENWSFDFDLLEPTGKMVKGRLRVCGTEKCDAGEAAAEDEVLKSAVSDALKRAAVHFGIGRYLYHMPRVWAAFDAQKKRFTETPQISEAAERRAVALALGGALVLTRPAVQVNTETGEVIERPPATNGTKREWTPPAPSAAGKDADIARGKFFADLKKLAPDLAGDAAEGARYWLYGLLLGKDRQVDPAGWPADYWQKLHEALQNAADEQKLGRLVKQAKDRAVSLGTVEGDPFAEGDAQAALPAQARGL